MKNEIEVPDGCLERIKELKNSLMFAMSKGSHELFHTNIWAWLIERDHAFASIFFGNGFSGEFLRVEREVGNRDLTVWVKQDGREVAYVVENKFKAAPRQSQLEEYEQDLRAKNQFGGGTLVSLQLPPGSEGWQWKVMTQSELMKGISKQIKDSGSFQDFEKQMVLAYVQMTQGLASILSEYSNAFGSRWPVNSCLEFLEDIRLGDIFKKIKAAELAEYIESQPDTEGWRNQTENNGLRLAIRPGFSNKSALLDVRLEKYRRNEKNRDVEWFCIGVQIQGNQYRRCVCSHDVSRFSKAKNLYEHFCDDKQWFGDAEFMSIETSMQKDFCKYETKDYSFAYQYFILKDAGFSALYARLKIEMEKIMSMLTRGEIKSFINDD